MSQENVEIVRAILNDFSRGDYEAALASIDAKTFGSARCDHRAGSLMGNAAPKDGASPVQFEYYGRDS